MILHVNKVPQLKGKNYLDKRKTKPHSEHLKGLHRKHKNIERLTGKKKNKIHHESTNQNKAINVSGNIS